MLCDPCPCKDIRLAYTPQRHAELTYTKSTQKKKPGKKSTNEKKQVNIEQKNNFTAVGPPTFGRPHTVVTRYVTQT